MVQLPLLDTCFRALALRPATIILATLFSAAHLGALLNGPMRHISVVGYIVQAVGLVLSVGGLYGTIKYKARPVLAFGVYLWLGVLLSVIGFCAMFALSLFPKGRAKLCSAITHHPEMNYPYESCVHDFWKLALVAFPVLLAALALKFYLTLVPWSFYRKLQSGDGLLDEPERAQYSAIVDHEEA